MIDHIWEKKKKSIVITVFGMQFQEFINLPRTSAYLLEIQRIRSGKKKIPVLE
jgi:hypothetical protein